MLRGQGIIVFFAVVALFHIINAGTIPKSVSSNPLSDPAKGILDKVRESVETGIEAGVAKAKKFEESVEDGIHTLMASVIISTHPEAPVRPRAVELETDADAPPPVESEASSSGEAEAPASDGSDAGAKEESE